MLCKIVISMHMQKIRDGPGRSRELWPNVRYADTLPRSSEGRLRPCSSEMALVMVCSVSSLGDQALVLDSEFFGLDFIQWPNFDLFQAIFLAHTKT